ncbi:zinc transporter ZntB [uncultured Litoreibacter sp.]|uniref:zinc transporter ZntB n=1 Tax=uncultured Litoreibacter sp. TaxID=1392394 RepID=UPI002616A1E8|nr:zinc transporter ZntB [uncultured Litoreibacter sp.]
MADPNALAALDVFADGTVTPAQDLELAPAAGAAYRWLHFDMQDTDLAGWMSAHLPPIPASAMMQTETRPRSNVFDEGVLINLRGVNLNAGAAVDDMVSLRMWMTDELLITARFRRLFAIEELREKAEAGQAAPSPAALVTLICEGLTDRIEDVSLRLEDQADGLEDALLDHQALDPTVLAATRRKAIRLRRHIIPSRNAMHVLASPEVPQIGPIESALMRENANRMDRSVEEIVAVGDRLTALADQMDAINANRIGRNSYVLSIVAAIFLPLGFLTGLFGMNVGGLPWTEWKHGFAVVSIVMGVIGLGLYLLFRARKWF